MKKVLFITLFVLSIPFFTGCSTAEETRYQEKAPSTPIVKKQEKEKKEPIKLGATLALSGPYAFIGQAEQYGIEQAVEEINTRGGIAGGRMIEVIYEDNAGDAKQAVNGVQKLIHQDQVDIFFSAFSHITRAVNALIGQTGKTLLYASTQPDMALEYPHHFRDFSDAGDAGITLIQKANQRGVEQGMYLGEVSDVCHIFLDKLEQEANRVGIAINKQEEYTDPKSDFRTILLKLNSLPKDTVLFTCTWKHSELLMKQMKELDLMHIPTYHINAPFLPNNDSETIRALYEENQSMSSWTGILEEGNAPKAQAFVDAFVEEHGEHPRPDVIFTYDDMHVLAQALDVCASANDVDHDCVRDYLFRVEYDGIGGVLRFDEQGLSERTTTLIEVVDGKWREVK